MHKFAQKCLDVIAQHNPVALEIHPKGYYKVGWETDVFERTESRLEIRMGIRGRFKASGVLLIVNDGLMPKEVRPLHLGDFCALNPLTTS